MTVDLNKVRDFTEKFYGEMPHPQAPSVKVSEYPAFARVAVMLKGQMPTPDDVVSAHAMLKEAGLSPGQFEYFWGIAKPVAQRLHGREPHMIEMQRLAQAHPSEIHDFYQALPHPQHPEVTAGAYARYWHAAYPMAREHWNREPASNEVVRFAIAGYDHNDINTHYLKGKPQAS